MTIAATTASAATYRLVAIDIDDTLLTDDLVVTPGTKAALEQAIRQGVIVTLATGRMFPSAQNIAKQLELNVPIITYQGGLIKNLLDEAVLYHRPVPTDIANRLIDIAEERGLHLQLYHNDHLIVNTDNDHIRAYSELSKVPYVIESDFRRVAILGSTKMLIIDEPETLDRLADELRTVFGSSLHITKSKPHYLEFLHPEATKGHALSYLAKHYRIPQEQTMAIGDSWNDHEMIQVAGLGVAMGNAVASLKQIADYITRSNNEEGVREVIEQFVLGSY